MQTSESIKEIAKALVGFHKEVGKIAKDSKNPFFKSSYASLSNILDGISDPLNNNGLAVVQFPDGEAGLTTRLVHISGEWMEATYPMRSVKETPQDRGSALTYQRRYALGAVLSLNIDEDDDANKASGKQVTAYNHKPIGNGKQVISNERFKKAIDLIDAGEIKWITELEKYALDSAQESLLLDRKEKMQLNGAN